MDAPVVPSDISSQLLASPLVLRAPLDFSKQILEHQLVQNVRVASTLLSPAVPSASIVLRRCTMKEPVKALAQNAILERPFNLDFVPIARSVTTELRECSTVAQFAPLATAKKLLDKPLVLLVQSVIPSQAPEPRPAQNVLWGSMPEAPLAPTVPFVPLGTAKTLPDKCRVLLVPSVTPSHPPEPRPAQYAPLDTTK